LSNKKVKVENPLVERILKLHNMCRDQVHCTYFSVLHAAPLTLLALRIMLRTQRHNYSWKCCWKI